MGPERFNKSENVRYRQMNQFDWSIAAGKQHADPEVYADLPSEMALCGPEGDPGDVAMINGAGRSLEQMLDELRARVNCPPGLGGGSRQHVGSPIRSWISENLVDKDPILEADGGYHRIVRLGTEAANGYGLAAISETPKDDFAITALLVGNEMAVERNLQGLGIGTGLVAARLIETGDLPTWHPMPSEYTDAAAGSVRRGLDLARKLTVEPEPDDSPGL